MTAVVYKMVCLVCGMAYIGFSNRYRGRKKAHKKLAQRLKPKQRVHQHIRLHGWANMQWEILHSGGDPKTVLNEIEPKFIADHGTLHPRGLNSAAGGGNWKKRTRRKRYKSPKAMAAAIKRLGNKKPRTKQ